MWAIKRDIVIVRLLIASFVIISLNWNWVPSVSVLSSSLAHIPRYDIMSETMDWVNSGNVNKNSCENIFCGWLYLLTFSFTINVIHRFFLSLFLAVSPRRWNRFSIFRLLPGFFIRLFIRLAFHLHRCTKRIWMR